MAVDAWLPRRQGQQFPRSPRIQFRFMDSAIYKDFARCHQAGCRTALIWPPACAALSSHRRAGRDRAVGRPLRRRRRTRTCCASARGGARRATARTLGSLGWARPDDAHASAASPAARATPERPYLIRRDLPLGVRENSCCVHLVHRGQALTGHRGIRCGLWSLSAARPDAGDGRGHPDAVG
jgi:hypothetical protein